MDYTQYFQSKQRPNGTMFVCRTDDCPEVIQELIFSIHKNCFDGCLPNDWIYETIWDAFEALKHDDFYNCTIQPDDYNFELIKWLQNPYSVWLCNDFGGEETDIIKMIGEGQREAIRMIYQEVDEWIKDQSV